MAERFTLFWSGPFSQWHPSPFIIEGVMYTCAEQYMMAEKARLFGDDIHESMIMNTAVPRDQKRYGRMVKGFDDTIWLANAQTIVKRASVAKFQQNATLKGVLLATDGTTLVEASPHDRLWGIGLRADDKRAQQRFTWQGKNWLGNVLTEVRDEMIADT